MWCLHLHTASSPSHQLAVQNACMNRRIDYKIFINTNGIAGTYSLSTARQDTLLTAMTLAVRTESLQKGERQSVLMSVKCLLATCIITGKEYSQLRSEVESNDRELKIFRIQPGFQLWLIGEATGFNLASKNVHACIPFFVYIYTSLPMGAQNMYMYMYTRSSAVR